MDFILDYQKLIIRIHKLFHFIYKNVFHIFVVVLIPPSYSDLPILLISYHVPEPMEKAIMTSSIMMDSHK